MNREEIKKQVLAALKSKFELVDDGHEIYGPEAYTKMGLPAEFVNKFVEKHESGLGYKETLFVEGQAVETLDGVYNLDILEGIAELIGVDANKITARGRGFRAGQYVSEIKKVVDAS